MQLEDVVGVDSQRERDTMTTAPVILCLNSGSSSLKFALYH
jgi:hypothetical protein